MIIKIQEHLYAELGSNLRIFDDMNREYYFLAAYNMGDSDSFNNNGLLALYKNKFDNDLDFIKFIFNNVDRLIKTVRKDDIHFNFNVNNDISALVSFYYLDNNDLKSSSLLSCLYYTDKTSKCYIKTREARNNFFNNMHNYKYDYELLKKSR